MRTNRLLFIVFLLILSTLAVQAQDPKPTPSPSPSQTPNVVGEVTVSTKFANSDPLYVEIRKKLTGAITLQKNCYSVNNLTLQKDRGTFLLRSGEFYFLEPVQGRVTAGVFIGDGEFSLVPPTETEKRHLSIFTEKPEVKEQFGQIIMYFSDKTFETIKDSSNAKLSSSCSQNTTATTALKAKGTTMRKLFRFNMSTRIMADILSPQRPGFFVTFIEGKKFGDLFYQIDPLGITESASLPLPVYPEQVALSSYGDTTLGIWTSFHMEEEYKKGTANSWADRRLYDQLNHEISATIQGTRLIAKDTITLQAKAPDVKILPLDLYQTLRVKSVTDENGQELDFIQEKKEEDADFAVILPKPLDPAKPVKITVDYEGIDVITQEGVGNFILNPSARGNWYPSNPFGAFGDRATFNLTFKYPKKYVFIGVGNRIGEETTEGDFKISKWTSDGVEYEVAGFNYGDFKSDKISDTESGYQIEVYANREVPDEIRDLQKLIARAASSGNTTETTIEAMNTTGGMKDVLTQAQNSMRIYDMYFGKLPYKRVAMTQQPNTFFGQAWTTLIFMPYMAYVGSTQRAQLFGLRAGTQGFWREVAAHEMAHQWWGHIVGWTSYKDQWMSEGFSEFSAGLYVQFTSGDVEKFINYWELQRKQIIEPRPGLNGTNGRKPYLAGPVTQGYKLISAKTGYGAYSTLIYPKGAYILHMLRMMMYDHKKGTGDARFKAMMTDFIKSHYNKPVSTNDLKSIVEKHMTPQMDIDGNKKMDWFFDEWVYGTEMPSYKFNYQIGSSGGKTTLTAKITQSGVSDKFVMLVPVYVDYGKGWNYLGSATVSGNSSVDLTNIPLPQTPKKVAIVALKDVLAENIDSSGK